MLNKSTKSNILIYTKRLKAFAMWGNRVVNNIISTQITKVNLPKTNSALFWEQFTNLGTKFKRNWKIGQFSPLPKMKGPIISNLFSYSWSFKLLYTLNHESKSLFMKVTFLYL